MPITARATPTTESAFTTTSISRSTTTKCSRATPLHRALGSPAVGSDEARLAGQAPDGVLMSDTIPERYRPAIREAVLKWNDAFSEDRHQRRAAGPRPAERSELGSRRHPLQRPALGHRVAREFRRRLADALRPAHGRRVPHRHPDLGRRSREAEAEWTVRGGPGPLRPRSTDPMPRSSSTIRGSPRSCTRPGHNLGMQHNFIGRAPTRRRSCRAPAFTSRTASRRP
jgi:hypothetical protein